MELATNDAAWNALRSLAIAKSTKRPVPRLSLMLDYVLAENGLATRRDGRIEISEMGERLLAEENSFIARRYRARHDRYAQYSYEAEWQVVDGGVRWVAMVFRGSRYVASPSGDFIDIPKDIAAIVAVCVESTIESLSASD